MKLTLREDINDDVVIDYDVNKMSFRFWNGKRWIYIPKNSDLHKKLKERRNTQRKIEQRQKEDPDFNLDDYKNADRERIKMKGDRDAILNAPPKSTGISKDDSKYHKGGSHRKTPNKTRPVVNPDFDDMTKKIMSDFRSNVLIPYYYEDFGDVEEVQKDPMDIGDRFFDDVDDRDLLTYQDWIEDERTPYVLLYFDCSGSWDTTAKTLAREKLGKYFESLQRQGFITYDDKSFASRVGNKGDNVGGFTYLKPVMEDIRECTKGKLSNVIVVTDDDFDDNMSDQTSTAPYVAVDGMVWYIFVGSYSQELVNHLKSEKDGWSRAFYYTTETKLGD